MIITPNVRYGKEFRERRLGLAKEFFPARLEPILFGSQKIPMLGKRKTIGPYLIYVKVTQYVISPLKLSSVFLIQLITLGEISNTLKQTATSLYINITIL